MQEIGDQFGVSRGAVWKALERKGLPSTWASGCRPPAPGVTRPCRYAGNAGGHAGGCIAARPITTPPAPVITIAPGAGGASSQERLWHSTLPCNRDTLCTTMTAITATTSCIIWPCMPRRRTTCARITGARCPSCGMAAPSPGRHPTRAGAHGVRLYLGKHLPTCAKVPARTTVCTLHFRQHRGIIPLTIFWKENRYGGTPPF